MIPEDQNIWLHNDVVRLSNLPPNVYIKEYGSFVSRLTDQCV